MQRLERTCLECQAFSELPHPVGSGGVDVKVMRGSLALSLGSMGASATAARVAGKRRAAVRRLTMNFMVAFEWERYVLYGNSCCWWEARKLAERSSRCVLGKEHLDDRRSLYRRRETIGVTH